MAELSSQDVVNHSQSVGDASPSDVPATTSIPISKSGDEDGVVTHENGIHTTIQYDEQALEDGTTRSDTDNSRADADGSVGDATSIDSRPVKKVIAAPKPVSFAKYSVPKVIAANAAKSQVEKANLTPVTAPTPQLIGRPRLVAKTTSSLSQKVKPFKAAAPDPMQVWNKNRIVPQPSTKNLTDEELKQQYGIHLTSRLQSDGDGKESKWADIDDDDEDDWAPETIEWGDGTKTTVGADSTPATKSAMTTKPSTPAGDASKSTPEPKPTPAFPTSIGPNATVLKLGARAPIQQSQRDAQYAKGTPEKPSLLATKSNAAPVPVKSPWAKLPPVETASPVEITPQMVMPPSSALNTQYSGPQGGNMPPAAREISADDFNRNWRDSTQPQLFMPNSGRYESVPENRRRMSRHEQGGFRASAVLQRPGQGDSTAPEPSAAFQTNRTSSDVMRRRASSTLSGDAALMVRRMSIRSGEAALSAAGSAIVEGPDQQPLLRQQPQVQTPATPATPAYQARGGDYMSAAGQTDAQLEEARKEQRRLMREQADIARKRRLEDEARLEAEKQERIRQKLAALGPDPKALKAAQEARTKAEADAKAKEKEKEKEDAEKAANATKEESVPEAVSASPPKPPQPNATGEPQQYGMMKVHALDSVKRNVSPPAQQAVQKALTTVQSLQSTPEDISPEPPQAGVNGARPELNDSRNDTGPVPEPIPRNSRPMSDMRSWARNDHRPPQANNLWGAPHNKALGNGTFDQSLAGYAPQDLSSRASSTGQGWMNGRTPTVGQSPQLAHIHQHVPETRSQALQNMTSPEPAPLAMNSEADSMLPVKPPAPIGPPQHHQAPQSHQVPLANGYGPPNASSATAGWNNFHNVARVQERAEYEQYQRDLAAKREEEKRAGSRAQANYNFEETFKQVQLGAQADQRHVNAVVQSNTPSSSSSSSSNMFGAVGSMPPSALGTPANRNSRFFGPQANGSPAPQPRAVTCDHIQVSRSPSPPPAEELFSSHPAYDISSPTPVVRLPPTKAVVKLPPAKPLTPEIAPAPPATVTTPVQATMPVQPAQPMTWAARVSMPAPKPAAPIRGVSQPIVKNPSWQERFNGLLGNGTRKLSDAVQASTTTDAQQSQSSLAVTAATKEPLDVMPALSASVSLPLDTESAASSFMTLAVKDVEDEEDLFEDREAGSLPILYFPNDAPAITWPRAIPSRVFPTPPDAQSAFIYLGSQWKDDKYAKQQFAIVRAPGSEKSIKRDLPIKVAHTTSLPPRSGARQPSSSSIRRGQRGGGRGRGLGVKA